MSGRRAFLMPHRAGSGRERARVARAVSLLGVRITGDDIWRARTAAGPEVAWEAYGSRTDTQAGVRVWSRLTVREAADARQRLALVWHASYEAEVIDGQHDGDTGVSVLRESGHGGG